MGTTTTILAEFDEETQLLLKEVDAACMLQKDQIREEAREAAIANNPLEVDIETLVWLKLIKAYGVLYNRAIDSGWVTGVVIEQTKGRTK